MFDAINNMCKYFLMGNTLNGETYITKNNQAFTINYDGGKELKINNTIIEVDCAFDVAVILNGLLDRSEIDKMKVLNSQKDEDFYTNLFG